MITSQAIEEIKRNHYVLHIHEAFKGKEGVSDLIKSLIENICQIYRYVEPDHYNGDLVIFQTPNDEDVFPMIRKNKHYDRNFLTNNDSPQLLIQTMQDGTINVISEIISDLTTFFSENNALFYHYKSKREHFYASGQCIPIPNHYNCASLYSTKYHDLLTALEHYKQTMARYSSCPILKEAWLDQNRIFFRGGGKDLPEKHIQISLENFLKSHLRGDVHVVREYNLGASKPVDIRVHWHDVNRAALIEIKWLGQSCREDGTFTTKYTAYRTAKGAIQLKNYLDLERQDTPSSITKGYLVVLDGRRNNLTPNQETITCVNGKHYMNDDLRPNYSRIVNNIYNFSEPIIMFSEPICE